jgi:hypothetical protein
MDVAVLEASFGRLIFGSLLDGDEPNRVSFSLLSKASGFDKEAMAIKIYGTFRQHRQHCRNSLAKVFLFFKIYSTFCK